MDMDISFDFLDIHISCGYFNFIDVAIHLRWDYFVI